MLKLPKLTVPKSTAWRVALAAAIILVVWTILATFVQWWNAPREAAQQRAEAVTQAETTKATGEAAQASLQVTNEVHREHARIDTITRRTDHAIKTAAGAETRVPAVAAELRRGVCQFAGYQREPDCAAVLGNDRGVRSAGADAGDRAASE